ncbi:MAG: hypothetical protein CME62_03525 [Halobacteriovoraceae bacterium]|nr:hypothetical protein [Halobacteriovoraceae bacterium]|tara:strand:- start:32885 stop:35635 length:2751 start_codon:yes stop_codon:yes gene_type:complete
MKYLFLFLVCFSSAFADEYLIAEMENLKNSLEKNDPDRTELSLRLADLYFDVSIQEGDQKNLGELREKSAFYYKSVLEGRDGLEKPSPESAVKIKFQLARVLNKLQKIDESLNYYQSVFQDELASKKFKRESALALAEIYEEKVNFNKSNEYYLHGVNLCESLETCNYAHYKRAWLLYKEVRLDEAIVELKKSLWDSKKQARDKVINDLLLFVSASVTDGHSELEYFQDLAKKTNQPELVRKLVESFYGAGNRIAGSNVLKAWNESNPAMFYELRLLEEFYGFRNWKEVRHYLTELEKRNASDIPEDLEEQKESKAMLKRVIVQLGSETEQDKEYNQDLLRVIDIYLSFYPNDEMRVKLQQGWFNAQENEELKLTRLERWIDEDIKYGFKAEHIRKLRQSRLALAQKLKKPQIVLHESLEISKIVDEKSAREFKYVYAHALYEQKEFAKALPIFVELADTKKIDSWSIKAQNLALDIYNVNKDFAGLVAQSKKWTENQKIQDNKELAKELTEMKKVQTQASFEHTASLGESTQALEQFFSYCFDKVFEEKSCQNAKVLAVKLKDQAKLVALLEKAKDEKALIVEYELMGEFSKAAKLQEKFNLTKNADISVYLKIALLYELDQSFEQRDRILNKLVTKLKREKKVPSNWEEALYLTFNEANLINHKTLNLNWSLSKKLEIANSLASAKEIKADHKVLTQSTTYTGPFWSKHVLTTAQKLAQRQAGISFYGTRSEVKFKRRTRALEKFQKYAVGFLEGADVNTRIYLLDMLKNNYSQFAFEILNTPLPEGLDEATLAQINEQLKQMSEPYQMAAGNYQNLQMQQLNTLKKEELVSIQNKLSGEELTYSEFIEVPTETEAINLAALDYESFNMAKLKLNQTPDDLKTLTDMQSFYKKQGLDRMASYFTGRINNIREEQ